MFSTFQSNSPAVQAHVAAQFSLFSDLNQQLFRTAQQVADLNVHFFQSLADQSLQTTQNLLTSRDPYEALSIASSHAQPVAEQVRQYQQRLASMAANAQVDLTKAAQAKVPETSRTASAVAEELTRRASEETQKSVQRQQDAIEKMAKTFTGKPPNSAAQPGKTATQ